MAVLGVDAGGSKTHAVLCDNKGTPLGAGRSGCANWEAAGLDGAGASLREAVEKALVQAKLEPEQVQASAFGLAGLDWPSDEDRLGPVVESLGLSGSRLLLNDAFLPLRAGIENGVGLAAIAGSGTTVVGRNASGLTARSFGAGYPFPDWGGAYDIAEGAVHAVAKAYRNMGPQTSLTERMLAFCDREKASALLEGIMRLEVTVGGAFAPLVLDAANQGDAAAKAIVERAGTTIGENAVSVAKELDMLKPGFVLVTAGGVFSSRNSILEESLKRDVANHGAQVALRPLQCPPVVGAVLLAMDRINAVPSADIDAFSAAVADALDS